MTHNLTLKRFSSPPVFVAGRPATSPAKAGRVARIVRLGTLVLGLLTAGLAGAAPVDTDQIGFPDAREVSSETIEGDEETRVITSQVSEVGDRLRFSSALEVPGTGQSRLLEVPSDSTPEQVFEHYLEELLEREGQVLFRCQGRACGRSNVWSNRVFHQSRLYGRDGEQNYLAGAWRDAQNQINLLSTYIVRRGNRTISVLEQQLVLPEDYRLPGSNPRERRVLGPFVIPFETGAVPRLRMAPETGSDLTQVARRYPGAVVYLSGFVPPATGTPAEAMEQAELALEAAARLLEGNGIGPERQERIVVGPAIPITDRDRNGPRVEVTFVRPEPVVNE